MGIHSLKLVVLYNFYPELQELTGSLQELSYSMCMLWKITTGFYPKYPDLLRILFGSPDFDISLDSVGLVHIWQLGKLYVLKICQ